jgi:hypothetical protein
MGFQPKVVAPYDLRPTTYDLINDDDTQTIDETCQLIIISNSN